MSPHSDEFQRKMIFSVWNVEQPARSPDLSPLEFFLEVAQANGKEIRCNGSEVTKAVIDSEKKG